MRCAIGLDFGTLSARAVVLELETGQVLGQWVAAYDHGVLDTHLPDGTRLPPDWALQHPGDYLTALEEIVPAAVREAGVLPEAVVGLGLDFTSSTVLPVEEGGEPLCLQERWKAEPHAWVKLWKHHGAQAQADRITDLIRQAQPELLEAYGGKVSAEWLLPKVLETLEQAPAVWEAADKFLEAGDWLTARLTGQPAGSKAFAGYKALRQTADGLPPSVLARLDPRLAELPGKQPSRLLLPGEQAGGLTVQWARRLGLLPGTPVAAAHIDAHAAVPAAGITGPGELLMILGTSGCDLVLGAEARPVPGICGCVADGILPGFYGYEAGQTAVGDLFGWFVAQCVPEDYARQAREQGVSLHQLLTAEASALHPGESGLLALDWWNGNRSVLVDAELTGLLVGMTLTTRPPEIYRALLEAVAFGKRTILEAYETHGVPVRSLVATGGIAGKNPLLLQIFADVLGREIRVCAYEQAAAVGSALLGAAAAGRERGGFDSIGEAAAALGRCTDRVYRPDPHRQAVYDRLYGAYSSLHELFGRTLPVMKQLKALKRQTGSGKSAADTI